MRSYSKCMLVFFIGTQILCLAEPESDAQTFYDIIQRRGEGALIKERTAVEHARTRERVRSEYGLELRPSTGENEGELALRIYLPNQWVGKNLRQQLLLATRSEQLRRDTLVWRDVISVYREFCTYRMLKKQLALTENELHFMGPLLLQADQSVEMNQLMVNDRARLYARHLELVTDCCTLRNNFLKTQQRIRAAMGPDADLEQFSAQSVIEMPSKMEITPLLFAALKQRSDYRQISMDWHGVKLAEEAVRVKDRFRLEYIQPSYRIDYEDGTGVWELSAAFTLPWGSRNRTVDVYQNQQDLYLAAQTQQQDIIEERLHILVDIGESFTEHKQKHNQRIKPVIERLNADLKRMEDVPLNQIRDILSVRERLLEASLVSCELECQAEKLAVDFAEEMGENL